ncbi:MAG: hypothetical protein HZA25_01060 [Candidatus Niyogibacteria bacterium]|nr:hypothetical protein [Candidatus Niyogibacteria bacterium]
MRMKRSAVKKEKILSRIVLKYYKSPKTGAEEGTGVTCAWCFTKNISKIGGGYVDENGKSQQICERCAVWRYKDDYDFRTLTAARARRRRIFDVGYLFNESVIDKYLELKNIPTIAELEGDLMDDIFIAASDLYNYLFSKEQKIELEVMESQGEIEAALRNRMAIIDFNKFFARMDSRHRD